MGAGDWPAGDFPAGEDGGLLTSGPGAASPPAALYIDGRVRDAVVNAAGAYVAVHPVDHQVEMRLLPSVGGIPANRPQGSGLGAIAIQDLGTMTTKGMQVVTGLFADMIAAGTVAIVSVTPATGRGGRVAWMVAYKNLMLPGTNTKTIEAGG